MSQPAPATLQGPREPNRTAAGASDSAAASLTPDQIRQRLFLQGSLQGTRPTGDWCVREAQPYPCEALRHRFDYYLLAQGEVTMAELRALVADELTRAHGAGPVPLVVSLWDRYITLRAHTYSTVFDLKDPATWRALLDEQHRVRRQILGEPWAQAFFSAEEAEARADLAYLERGAPLPSDPGLPVLSASPDARTEVADALHQERISRYGPAAADRLAQADANWADWARRLRLAQSEWARLQSATELSSLQRRQAMQAHIQAHFQPDERRRVEALLDL